MSFDGPCSVLRGGMTRGFSGSGFSKQPQQEQQQEQQQQQQQQQHVSFGVGLAYAAPATSSASSWNDEPLPDMLPTLRSVSSLVMSMDADESSAAQAANNGSGTNKSSSDSSSNNSSGGGGASKDVAVGSKMVDILMTPLPAPPAPMDTSDRLMREQSFPPPFGQPRFRRDQSFPPPVQDGGLTAVDMLQPAPSLAGGWSTLRPTDRNSGGESMDAGDILDGFGKGPETSKFQGLGFPGSSMCFTRADQPSGASCHPGGAAAPSGFGGGGHSAVYEDQGGAIPPSSSHQRHPSFDKLAEMIPGIPQWTNSSPPSSSPPPSTGVGSSGIASSSSTTAPIVKPPLTISPTSYPTRGRQPQQQPRGTRPGKKTKKHLVRRAADSPPRVRWSLSDPATTPANPAVSAADVAAATRRPSSSGTGTGTGKRSIEPPLSCGPTRPGGPVDLAKQERRRIKIQRYLYKRSRRKFANSTRDASPSRSRPKAAMKRLRVKGKFVKTTPDFISVGKSPAAGGVLLPQEVPSETEMSAGNPNSDSSSRSMPPLTFPAAGGVRAGAARRLGGVRSVRDGGSVNTDSDTSSRKAFSSTPSSSFLPRAGSGTRLPQASAPVLNGGGQNVFFNPSALL